jgi:hypothetical protein
MVKATNSFKILLQNSVVKHPVGSLRTNLEDNNKTDLRDVGCVDVLLME